MKTMFKEITLSAAAAVAAIAAIPAAADAESFGGADRQARQLRQGDPRGRRPDVPRQDPRSCRGGGGAGTLLGAIAGGLLGRSVAGLPGERIGFAPGRGCR